jgi:hypothetical protein
MGFSHTSTEEFHTWESVSAANARVDVLRDRRVAQVCRGQRPNSWLVWHIETYTQAALHRVVMLGDGCTDNWESRNPLAAVLCARALLETVATLWDFEKRLADLVAAGDLKGMSTLVQNRSFGTRQIALTKENPETTAINAITLVKRMCAEQPDPGRLWALYEDMSEYCHPNSFGHLILFTSIDFKANVTTLSDALAINRGTFMMILYGYSISGLLFQPLESIERMLPSILDIEATLT